MHMVRRSDPLCGSDELRICPTRKGGNFFMSLQNYFLQPRFIIFGPDVKTRALTIFLIVGPVAAFCAFVSRKLIFDFTGISVMLIAIVFTLYDLILLLLLTTSRTHTINRVFASYCSESSTPAQRNLLSVCMVNLPWDVTTEILSMLPVKSLMRFKCVSKSFYDLISNDPIFIKNHLYHHRRLQSSMKILVSDCTAYWDSLSSCSISSITPGDDTTHELKLPFGDGPWDVSDGCIHNSCDGLFCIELYTYKCDEVMIWNPSTRQLKKLPACQLPHKEGSPCVGRVRYSLAHDSLSGRYKLLGLCRDLDRFRPCLYSSEMEKWRYVDNLSFDHVRGYCRYERDPTIVNGAFHWLASPNVPFRKVSVVVSLDVSNETYATLELPQALKDSRKYGRILCALKGKLCVLCASKPEHDRELWVMNEYGVADSMTRMFSISGVELPEDFYRPLYMLEDDTFVIYRIRLKGSPTSFYKDGRYVCDTSAGKSYEFTFSFVYLESLIPPSMIL
ncbi:hypothetical protein CASFOL_023847 [Castilleja foliolosa]|uniref:F-box domain-containing protein n=1 Tax=Castilleja foliolosa TaxID=1961234 RepID=A0ABD3CLN8_9LAMI